MDDIAKVDINHLIMEWSSIKTELGALRERESTLRRYLLDHFFGTVVGAEGRKSVELGAGYKLSANFGQDRKVDHAAMISVVNELREAGIDTENIVEYEAKLALKVYRKLSDQQRKLFDSCLIIKDKSPTLELVAPKIDSN